MAQLREMPLEPAVQPQTRPRRSETARIWTWPRAMLGRLRSWREPKGQAKQASMESVSFDTLTFDHPAAAGRRAYRRTLHLPMQTAPPLPCMVLLTSSAGVQRHREHYYAQALNEAGIAAADRRQLHRPRRAPHGGRSNPGLGAQMEGDAFAALALLRTDPRIDPRADRRDGRLQGRRRHAERRHCRAPALAAAASPTCSTCMSRSAPARPPSIATPSTHGRPMFSCWPARDDYTPAPLAIEYAERMRAAGNGRIRVKVYSSAHHGWESIGPVFDIKDAENWSCCKNFIEDDGSHFVAAAGRAMTEPEYQAWARQHCVTKRRARRRRNARAEAAGDGGSAGFPACHGFGVAKSHDFGDLAAIPSGVSCRPVRFRRRFVLGARWRHSPPRVRSPPLPMSRCGSDRSRRGPRRRLAEGHPRRRAITGSIRPGMASARSRRPAPAPTRQRPRRCSPPPSSPMPATSRPAGCTPTASTRISTSSSARSSARIC